MTKIIYKDIAPGAAEDTTPAMTDLQPFCNLSSFMSGTTPQKISTLEDGYSKMDGTFLLFPDDPSTVDWGAWSRSMANETGIFTEPVVLTLTQPQLYSSVGLSFQFDPYEPNWCNDLNIKWYKDDVLLADQDFVPDAYQYSCIYEVQNYNKIVIAFRSMSKPYRYLKLKTPVFGIERTFEGKELRSVNMFQACSVISEDLEINTTDMTISSNDPIPFLFQRKQPMEFYQDDKLIGVTYISKSKRAGASLYDIESNCKLGLADESNHPGGVYNGITFFALVTEILGGYFPFEMEEALKTILVYGWLPIATRRENLAQAAFAIGAIADTSMSTKIRIFSEPTEITAVFGGDRVYTGSTVETAGLTTGVEVTEHQYKAGSETTELYNDTLSGTAQITCSEPMCGFSISGGTILSSGANYAIISGNGTVVLTGTKYAHTTRVITIDNPNVSAADVANVVSVTDATLVSPANSAAVSQRVYDYYQRRETVTAEVVFQDEKPGDRVSIQTEFDGVKTGTIKSIDAGLARKRIGQVVILCD